MLHSQIASNASGVPRTPRSIAPSWVGWTEPNVAGSPGPWIAVAIVVLALTPIALSTSRGQDRSLPPLDEFHIRTYGPVDGLPAANVRGLAQLSDGYLYVATGRGLTRFDGHRFHPVILGARTNSIDYMQPDSAGRLWFFGPGNDLMGYYQDARFHQLPPSPPVPWGAGTYVDGDVWFGSNEGLVRITTGDTVAMTRYTRMDGIPGDTVIGLFALASGERVVVTAKGLARMEADRSTTGRYRFVPFGPHYQSGSHVRVDANGLWLARFAAGYGSVLRYHDARFTRYDAPGSPHLPFEWFDWRDTPVRPLVRTGNWRVRVGSHRYLLWTALRARDGSVWLGAGSETVASRHELVRYVNGRADTIPLRSHSGFQTINHLWEDHEGSIWVGTDHGLFQVSARRVAALGIEHGLAEQFTVPVLQTRDGALWIGTWGGGLHRFHEGRLANRYTTEGGLPDDHVRALYEAADGVLWVGLNTGLAAIRGGRVVVSERTEHVRAFAETGHGATTTLWIGTANRLLARTPRGVTAHRPADWRGRSIWALHAARDGSLWIGSERGLFRLVGDSVHAFEPSDGLRGSFVTSISEEEDGTMWFGTYEHGLHRFRGSRFVAVTTAEGLLHNGIWRMLRDERGGVWMSSDGGIFRVGHQRLHEVADALERGERPRAPLSPMIFREAEGMPSRESNRASPGGWRLRDGRLVFNNIAGVVVIDPIRAVESGASSPTVILEVIVDGKAMAIGGPAAAKLPPGTKQLAFEFAALSYLAPQQNRYRYRLDGYDTDWVHAGTDRRAHYTNLPPGGYTFRAQGSSAAGVWSDAASMPIVVGAFVWQTWWFRLLAGTTLVALLVAAHRYRVRRLMEMERLRLRIAADLHDDVGSNLSSIALLSEMLQGDAQLGALEQRQLQRINSAAEETVSALRDIIWLVGPKHDDLVDLVRRMRGIAADVLSGTACRFDSESVESRRIGMTFMRNVLLIYKEALHNVHKHARAGEVVIAVGVHAGEFVLRIEDNGVGFDEASIVAGHGLENMRRRTGELGGRLEIVRADGGGTRITLSAPLAYAGAGRTGSVR